MVDAYPERLLLLLEQRLDPLNSLQARELLRMSLDQWQRARRQRNFPKLERWGREQRINCKALAEYLRFENRLRQGLPLRAVGRRIGRSDASVRAMVQTGEFPGPIGTWYGTKRWALAEIEGWEVDRLLRLGLTADKATPPKKAQRALKRVRSG